MCLLGFSLGLVIDHLLLSQVYFSSNTTRSDAGRRSYGTRPQRLCAESVYLVKCGLQRQQDSIDECGSPVNDAEVGACGKVGPMERTTGPGRKGRDEIWTCLFLLALSLWQSAHLCAPPSAASVPAWESAEGAGWMMSSTAVDFSANSRTQKAVFPSRLPSQTSQSSPINHQPVNPPSFAIPTPITVFACNHLGPQHTQLLTSSIITTMQLTGSLSGMGIALAFLHVRLAVPSPIGDN